MRQREKQIQEDKLLSSTVFQETLLLFFAPKKNVTEEFYPSSVHCQGKRVTYLSV